MTPINRGVALFFPLFTLFSLFYRHIWSEIINFIPEFADCAIDRATISGRRQMMKLAVSLVMVAAFILLPIAAFGGIRDEKPNLIGGELGGKALIYSLSYERYFFNRVGIGVGAMGFAVSEGGVGLFPIYLSLIPVGDRHGLYISAGADYANASNWDEVSGTWLGIYSIGYQYQSYSGFFVRPTINMIYKGDGYIVLPGVAIGGSF